MKIILISDVENLGESGDVVSVKPGYARNMLIPMGLALRASKRNIAIATEQKKAALAKVEITIEVKVGEEEKMFGSITNKDIHNELIDKGFELDKNQIFINDPIKTLGIYHVTVKVSKDITSDVKLYVIKG